MPSDSRGRGGRQHPWVQEWPTPGQPALHYSVKSLSASWSYFLRQLKNYGRKRTQRTHRNKLFFAFFAFFCGYKFIYLL